MYIDEIINNIHIYSDLYFYMYKQTSRSIISYQYINK